MTRVTEERLKKIFNSLIKELDLDYGNAGFDHFSEDGIFVGDVEFLDNTILTIDVDFGLEAKMIDEEIEVEFLSKIKETITNYAVPINIRIYPIINEISENKFKVKFYEDCGRFHLRHTTFNTMDAVKEYVSARVHQVKALYRL